MKIFVLNLLRTGAVAAAICGSPLFSSTGQAQTNGLASTNQPPTESVDAREQFKTAEDAAQTGDPKALFALSGFYQRGTGVERQPAKAAELARQAAEKGYAPAQALLGSFYGRGVGMPKNVKESMAWYRKAADQGYALAQYALGGFYEQGRGVDVDIDQAINWYKKAADQGYVQAQCQLGLLYFNGVPGNTNHSADYQQAVVWLKKAADQGYVGAMNNLGWCHQFGLGGLKSDCTAAGKWYSIASEHGNARAQVNLAQLYTSGQGEPLDLVQAFVWLRISVDGGNADARVNLAEFLGAQRHLTKAELQKADEMIQYYNDHHSTNQFVSPNDLARQN